MKQFSEQLQKQSEKVRLSARERSELRDRLTTYMEYHPVPESVRTKAATPAKKAATAGIVSQPFTSLRFNATFFKAVVPTLTLVMLVAVPVLAEQTAPGDVLYPVKVSFNEEIRSQLASSPYEEIEWEAARIERRIAEARLLASEGKLTEEVEAEVAAAVKEQTEKTKEKIAALKSTDADEGAIAEISFATTLAVQNELLESDVQADGAREPHETGAVLASVVAEESSAAEAAQEQSTPAYEKLLARLEAETTNAEELFASIATDAERAEVKDIERRLSDIGRKVAKAQTLHNQQDGAVATTGPAEGAAAASAIQSMDARSAAPGQDVKSDVTLLREAMTDVRKLISFMTNIDVQNSVTVDELVPVDATDDERRAVVIEVVRSAEALQAQTVEGEFTNEKIALALTELESLLEATRQALDTNQLEQAETVSVRLVAIKDDIEKMVEREAVPLVDEEEASASSTPDVVEDEQASTTVEVEATVGSTSSSTVSVDLNLTS